MKFRQGDVLIEAIGGIVGAMKKERRGRIVLAEGEVTGHAHAILDEDVQVYERAGMLYLRVGEAGATVVHEEHSPIVLPPGSYRVQRQREYSPEAIRNVSD